LKVEGAGVTVKAQDFFTASKPQAPSMPKPDDDTASQPRRSCLDEQEIVDFASGLLPAAKLPGVEEHLSSCDKCTELVAAAAPLIGTSSQVTRSIDGREAFGPQGITSQPTTPNSGRSGARDRPLLAPGTPLDNTYQVVRFLGRGGMGDVYEVKHARLAGRYAAKLLSSDLADNAQAFSRFQREALIASGLSHPNIVNVIDFCHLSDGLPCLVMEFLDGVDLAQILALGQMSLMRTLRLVRQIVSALSTLHGHQIIHRDLKPQNIFVLPEHDGEPERVKLVDFGLAKRSNPSMVVTHDRTLLGTPQYMAPEQAVGNAENVGPEADQFSLAAIVYEMLAGRHPFGGDVLSTVLYRIVHEPPTPLASLSPHVPVHVIAAIERALSKDRQARFPSVKAFLQALEGQGAAMTPAPPVTKKVHRSWFIRREVLASAGVLAVAAGVVGAVRMMRPTPEPAVWRASQGGAEPAAGKTPASAAAAAAASLTIDRSAPTTTTPPAKIESPPAPENTLPPVARVAAEKPPAPEPKRRQSKIDAPKKAEPARAEKTAAGDPSRPPTDERPANTEPPPPESKPGPLLIEKL
jgi:tRNA A-37 threonylcarbamoyl transferase component Bud32